MEQELANKKREIETLEDVDKWEYYKKIHNPYELVFTTSGKYPIPSSISVIHPLSRSYFKLIEILMISKVCTTIERSNFRTGHLCEGPGGFIEAVYTIVEKERKKITKCYAMSLKSTKSHIPGWKRAATFLKKHPEIQIIYGAANTGDILDPINQESYIHSSTVDGKLYIVTGDGGFDFTTDYYGQERGIFPLLVATSYIALQTLSVGNGVFILKIFDVFEEYTQLLLYMLGQCFDKWTLYKPAMSRPCNSEQYFIGSQFTGASQQTLQILSAFSKQFFNYYKTVQQNETTPLINFDMNIFNSIAKSIYNDNTFVYFQNNLYTNQYNKFVQQKDAIHTTIEWVQNSTINETELWKRNYQISKMYCDTFHIPYKLPATM